MRFRCSVLVSPLLLPFSLSVAPRFLIHLLSACTSCVLTEQSGLFDQVLFASFCGFPLFILCPSFCLRLSPSLSVCSLFPPFSIFLELLPRCVLFLFLDESLNAFENRALCAAAQWLQRHVAALSVPAQSQDPEDWVAPVSSMLTLLTHDVDIKVS